MHRSEGDLDIWGYFKKTGQFRMNPEVQEACMYSLCGLFVHRSRTLFYVHFPHASIFVKQETHPLELSWIGKKQEDSSFSGHCCFSCDPGDQNRGLAESKEVTQERSL